MEFHVARKLRVRSDLKHRGLYQWAINELDPKGKAGPDLIPWPWTLFFAATSVVVGDELRVKRELDDELHPVRETSSTHNQVIRVQLVPGDRRSGAPDEEVTYSMLGTDREIKQFQLDIRPVPEPGTQPFCKAWGCVSYTAEGRDFIEDTHDDILVFTLCVHAEEYAHLAAKVSAGEVNDLTFSISTARGFYAEWTPDIYTRAVKVLTPSNDEQSLELPPGFSIDPPRLGEIGTTELYVNRRLELVGASTGEYGSDAPARSKKTASAFFSRQNKPAVSAEDRGLRIIGSLSSAAWLIVLLQVLILGALLNR